MKLRKGTIHKAINPSTGRIISVSTAKEKAWTAFAKFIRARDPHCITCGAWTTEAGHFHHNSDKGNKQLGGNELWYDERNVHGQCGKCNRWGSGERDIYAIRLEELYGFGILQELNLAFRTERKWSIPELLQIEETYQRKFRAMDTATEEYEIV